MISLNRNGEGELVAASGIRTRRSSIYVPGQTECFRISRSKFSDFLMCQRCFYLDRVKGLKSPSMPGWSLNALTDTLLKKEFDLCREQQKAHRLFGEYGLENVVPFKHAEIDNWRDSLHHGLQYQVEGTNIILHGGVDDVWHDLQTGQVIIVDYKSQASSGSVTEKDYLSHSYHQSYKVQMDVYAYLMEKMGFDVSKACYFYVCNADGSVPSFDGKMKFTETLVRYFWDTSWLEKNLSEMIAVLNSRELPDRNPSCENCAYAFERAQAEGRVKGVDATWSLRGS